jgi:uncharacterized protein (TIGR03089 family)
VPAPADPARALLAALVAADSARPRITVYDDGDGPRRGERVELSARVLANWVAKAANLLQDELGAGPGTVVRLDLPPHWRTLYWALASWVVGACVDVSGSASGDADVVVTDEVGHLDEAPARVLVTLAALARSAEVDVPPGVVDEAREIATHGDVVEPYDAPAPSDPALRDDRTVTSYADLAVPAEETARWHTTTTDTGEFLRLALSVLAADGSLVLSRGTPGDEVLARRLTGEGVTRSA